MSFKHVLLCYDGSEQGRRALIHGAELALEMKSAITVLAIVTPSHDAAVHWADVGGVRAFDCEADFRRILDESIHWLEARNAKATPLLVHGEVIDVILDVAARRQVDLIVVGQYPSAGAKRWWSSIQKPTLAEHAKCSVLISVNP